MLFSDLADPIPVSLKFEVASLIHIDFNRTAEPCKGNHNAANLLARLSYRAIENVFDQFEGVLFCATVGLCQLESLLKKPVVTLQTITRHVRREALAEPLLNSPLI